MIRSSGDVLEVTIPAAPPMGSDAGAASRRHGRLQEAERAHILATLKETRWVIAGPRGAATRLGSTGARCSSA